MWKSRWLGLLLGAGLILNCAVLAVDLDAAPSAAANRSEATKASATTEDAAEVNRGLASLKTGTTISAELNKTLDARIAKPGDIVSARVTKNVKHEGHKVIRKGDHLLGRVTSVDAGSKYQAGSKLGVTFDRLIRGNAEYQLNTVVSSIGSTSADLGIGDENSLLDDPVMNEPMAISGSLRDRNVYLKGGRNSSADRPSRSGPPDSAAGSPASADQRKERSGGYSTQSTPDAVLEASKDGPTQIGIRPGLSTPLEDIQLDTQASVWQNGQSTSILGSRFGMLRLKPGSQMKFKVSNGTTVETSKR